jgi:putative transposase
VESEEQLLHLTRYIHLNPVTAYLIKSPDQWAYSSYAEYISQRTHTLCDFKDYVDLDAKSYSDFTNNQIGYQKELAIIKNLKLD